MYLDFAQFCFRLCVLIIIDILKLQNGQKNSRFILNTSFYLYFMLEISIIKYDNYINIKHLSKSTLNIINTIVINILFNLILILDTGGLISWTFNKAPINTQSINAISPMMILREFPSIAIFVFIAFIFCIFISFFPCFHYFMLFPNIISIVHHLFNAHLFLFILSIIHDFHDTNNKSLIESGHSQSYITWLKDILTLKMESKPKILSNSKHLKNLILIQLESFPYEFIENDQISPNMNNYSRLFEYIAPIKTVPYSTWSIGATILLQTGIPQIMPDTSWPIRGRHSLNYIMKIKGISDILHSGGYEIHYATNGPNHLMGFNAWIRKRKYKNILTSNDDKELFEYFTNHELERIDNESRSSNFQKRSLNFIVNVETHAPYLQSKWCNFTFPKILPKQRCFYCIDHLVGDFVRKFLELKMEEHTVLAIFPDHHPFLSDFLWYKKPVNDLFVLFPGIKKIDQKLKFDDFTYYDFAPTIFDLVGVKNYVPQFPFGVNIYSKKNTNEFDNDSYRHRKPDTTDLAIIYKFLHFEKGKNVKNRYKLTNNFTCFTDKKKSFYYSDSPCNVTYD